MVFGFLRNSDNATSISRNNKKSLKHRKAAAVKSRNRKLLFEGLEERRVLTVGATQAEAAYSAQAILNANPGAPSGVYWIDPNGGSTSDAFQAYADMTTSGGGWTQVLRVDGNQPTFTYDSTLWTNSATLNPNAPGTFHTEYKNQAFSNLPLTQVLLSMETGGSTNSVVIPKSATSLQQVFNSGYQPTSLGKSTWLGLVPGSAIDPNGYAEGFNNISLSGPASPYAKVRIGALGNNEPDVGTPDGWLGIGGYVASGGQLPINSAGNQNWPGMGLVRDIRSYGYVYVRGAVPADSTAPTVTSTFASGTIPAGTTTLNVNFSEATLGGASNSNYELRSAGPNGVIGDGDDVIIPVSASYGSTGSVLTVAALSAGGYQLTVKSGPAGVTDTSGNQLDGDNNGIAGGDFVKNFIVGGSVLSFGADYNEALGDGVSGQTNRPVAASVAGITDAIAVAGHFSHGLALKADGTVWAWGYNGYGQLGDGTTISRPTAVQVAGLSNIVAIATGDLHSLALRSDGTVWAWGYNGYGQLGDGTFTNRLTPVQVPGLTGVTSISAGFYHSTALLSNGTVRTWGFNGNGSLGDGTSTTQNTPVPVAGLTNVTAVDAGGYHNLALLSDGTVRAWGENAYGDLGDGTATPRFVPVSVVGLSGVTAIDASDYAHSLAILSDGTVRAWGRNSEGQLGDGTTIMRTTPVPVVGLNNVVAIDGGFYHSAAVLKDGTVKTWGQNSEGQIGDGTFTTRLVPTLVPNVNSATSVDAAGYSTYVLRQPIVATGSISATVDGSGNLTVNDTDVIGKNNQFTLTLDSSGNLVISDANEQFAGAPAGWTLAPDGKSISILASSFTGSITVNGALGDDSLTLDYSNGDPLPAGGLVFNGGTGGNDLLSITGNGLASGQLTHTNANDGTLLLNGKSVSYTGLDPININTPGANWVLEYTTAAAAVTLADDGAGNLLVTRSGVAEQVTIAPAGLASVTIRTGAGADTIEFDSLPAGWTAGISIDGQGGADVINFDTSAIVTGGALSLVDVETANLKYNITAASLSGNATTVNVDDAPSGQIQDGIDIAGTGATVKVASGTYTENVNATASGKDVALSAGASPGQVFVVGNLTLNAGDSFPIEINGTNAGTDYDNWVVMGVVTLGGATFPALTGTYTPVANDIFTIINNDLAEAPGTFNSLPAGSLLTLNGRSLKVFYTGNDGNDVILADQIVSTIYIDDSWNAFTAGQNIGDADLGTTGNQPAIYGYNAFASFASALPFLTASGTIIVNGGIYAESVSLTGTQKIEVTGPDAAQTVTINQLASVAGTTITLEGSSVLQIGAGNGTQVIGGIVNGSGSLVKQGTGTVSLAGANSYSGGTTISSGTLQIDTATGAGSGSVTLNDVNTLANNTFFLATGAFTVANSITVANQGTGIPSVGTTTFASASGTLFTNTITLNKAATLTGGNADRTTYTNVISGNVGTLTITGGARTTFEANNVFVGNVAISGSGTILQVGTGGNNQIPDTSNVDVGASTTFQLAFDDEAINSLTGSGTVKPFDNLASRILTIGANNGGGTFSGVMSNGAGAQTLSLVKAGSGTQTLNGNSSFTGPVNVNGGVLKVGHLHAFGANDTSVNKVIVASGAAVDFNGVVDAVYGYTISGAGVGGAGALVNTAGGIGNGFAQASNIKLAANATIGGTGNWALLTSGYGPTTLDLNGFTLTKDGGNTFTLANATITAGAINVAGGTFTQIGNNKPGGHDASNVAFSLANTAGATLDLGNLNFSVGSLTGGGGTGGNVVLGTGTLTVGNLGTSTNYAGVIGGAGGLTKVGTGTLTLSGPNTFTGNVAVNNGVIKIGNSHAFGTYNTAVTKVVVASGAAVDFNGVIDATFGYTISGTGVGGTGALVNTAGGIGTGNAQASNIKLAADATIGGTGNWALLTFGYAPTTLDLNGFTLTKDGSNTFTLANSTITAGAINIAGGTFTQIGNNKPGGHDASNVAFSLANTAGAKLDLGNLNFSVGSLAGGGGSGGNVVLGTGTLTVGNLGTSTAYAGAISGTGGLSKVGAGTLTLSGTNLYSGTTTINGGSLALSGGSAIADAGAVNLSSGTLSLNNSETIGSLSAAGGTFVALGSNTLTVGDTSSTTVAANISGNGLLTKQGTGVLTLTGTNSYTGTTNINAGTLLVNGTNSGTGAVNVNNTGTLGGSGSIGGTVTAASGSIVVPGSSAAVGTVGTLTVGGLILNSGSTFQVDLTNTPTSDKIIVTGSTLTLTNPTITPTAPGNLTNSSNQNFRIIQSGTAATGTFNGLPEGSQVAVAGSSVPTYVTYQGGTSSLPGTNVDLNTQPIINGTSGPDTLVFNTTATGYTYSLNGGAAVAVNANIPFTFNGGDGDDVMQVNLNTFTLPTAGVFFNGNNQDLTVPAPTPNAGDVLKVVGNGANVEYRAFGTPGTTNKNLNVNTSVGLITATGVEPGDLSGFATVDVVFSGANEVLSIDNGFDATTGLIPALVVTGTTGGNPFEGAHLWNNTTVRILTANNSIGGTDGNDSVVINSASNAHNNANLWIDTGSGTDSVTVAGNATVTGSITIFSQNISFTGGTASASAVVLNAGTGAITNTTTPAVDVSATQLTAQATTGIDLDTTVTNIQLTNSGAASVNIDETDALNLLGVNAAGSLTIVAGGALTDDTSANTQVTGNANLTASSILLGDSVSDAVNFGSLTFTSTGSVTITENSNTNLAGSSSGTAVSLTSTGGIIDGASANDITASTSLALVAATGIGSADAIETTTPAVEATTISGGIFLNNAGNLQIGGVSGGLAGLNATSGNIVITTTGSLQNIEGVKNTNGDITLSTIDAAGAGQDITVAAAIEATAGQVTFNAGDDLFVTSTVKAGTTVTGNVDSGNADGGTGGVFTLAGSVGAPVAITAPGGTFLNGNTDNDTFNVYAQTTTAFSIDGDQPVGTLTGDILAMSVVGTGATLTVGGTAPYNGAGSGTWTFAPSFQSIRFKSIEDSQITGSYHLTYDFANSTPVTTDLFVMRDATTAKLQLRDGSNAGQILFQANLAPNLAGNGVLSLKVLGTGNNESVTVDDINTLPVFAAAVPGTPDNAILAGQASLLFQGAGGTNKLNFALTGANISQTYAIGNGAGVGSEGEVQTVAGAGTLTSYFTGLGPAGSVNRTGGNNNPGSLTILGDNLGNTINVSAAVALTNVNPVTYTPFNFSAPGSHSYSAISLFGLDGNDKLNFQGFGNTVANNPTITLDGGNNDDTLQVGDTSGNSGLISILGQSGNDTVVLASDSLSLANANRTDQIFGKVTVDGGAAGGNDQLFLVALANTAALTNVQITSTTIDNVTPAASTDVTFSNINLLDVTTTNLADTITTTLTAPSVNNDLAVVTVHGGDSSDQFYLHIPATPTNTPAGLTNINLLGDAGDDFFGSNADRIIPAYSKASGADIFINGGTPDLPAFDPISKNSIDGDKLTGDRIYLDMSSATAPVIVDTVTGFADSASHRRLVYNGIEDIDLYDNAGQLQNVHQGALYMRATEASDYLVLMGLTGGKVRIRANNAYYGDYAPVTKLVVHARGGNDYIATSAMPANLPLELYGDEGDDSITGSAAGDLIVGGEGLDRLSGGAGGVDEIWGDVFNPITSDPNLDIMLDPTNPLAIGIRASQVDKSTFNSLGGPAANPSTDGNDIITTAQGNGADRIYGQGGNDIVTASAQDDVIYGGDGIDNLSGANGNDRIYGGAGNDNLAGEGGDDFLYGGDGNDTLNGGLGNDVLVGGIGQDILRGDQNRDMVIGGTISYSGVNSGTADSKAYGDSNDVAMLELLNNWRLAVAPSIPFAGLTATPDGEIDSLSGGDSADDFYNEAVDLLIDYLPATGDRKTP